MTKGNNSKLNRGLIAFAVSAMALFCMSFFFDFYFDLNDDAMIQNIVGGAFTGSPSGHAIYVMYPLAAALACLSKIITAIPWFGVLLTGSVFVSLFLVVERLLKLFEKPYEKIVSVIVYLVCYFSTLLYQSVFIQYSFAAGLLASTGIFLIMTSDVRLNHKSFIKENAWGIILIVIGFLLRSQMVLLMGPVLLVGGLSAWINSITGEDKRNRIECFLKYLKVVFVLLLFAGLGFVCNKIAYMSSEWSSFDKYNEARTELYDYQQYIPKYEEFRDVYRSNGLYEEDIVLLNNYNISIDDNLTTDKIESVIKINKEEREVSYFQHSLKDMLIEYKWRMTHLEDGALMLLVWVLYGLVFITALLYRRFEVAVETIVLGIARTVSWLYPMMRGRIKNRITDSLFVCEIFVLAALLINVLLRKRGRKIRLEKVVSIVVAAVLMCSMLYGFSWGWGNTCSEFEKRDEINKNYLELIKYCENNKENYYVIDVFSTVKFSEKMFSGYSNEYRNFEICGGWSNNSPLYFEKLRHSNINNLAEDLVAKDNIFFVSDENHEVSWLEDFYEAKGHKVHTIPVTTVGTEDNVFIIYEVVR